MPKKIYPTPGKVFHIATLNRITSCKDSDFFFATLSRIEDDKILYFEQVIRKFPNIFN
jgi:hypothetical protein